MQDVGIFLTDRKFDSNYVAMTEFKTGASWRKWMEDNLYSQRLLARSAGLNLKTVSNIALEKTAPSNMSQRKMRELAAKVRVAQRRWR